MARRKKRIYLGRDSVFRAVRDTGAPGVSSKREFVRLVLAQLADLADYRTKDHSGREVKWTKRLWSGRMLVLRRINKKKRFGMARLLQFVDRVGRAYLERRAGPLHLAEAIDRICKKYGVSTREARGIVRKVNKQREVLRKIIENIDGVIKAEVERLASEKGISRKKAVKRAARLGRRVARRLKRRFDAETKRIASYLWGMIPKRYKRNPLRIWYYVQALWLAYYIRHKAREKGMDWRAIDWAAEIDWRQGYRHAKNLILKLLRTGLEHEYDPEYEKYIEQIQEEEYRRWLEEHRG